MTSLTIYVSNADLVEDLMASFRLGGCAARRTGLRSCSVDHPAEEREARIEVAFFLRAWRTRHGRVRALLAP